MKALVVTADDVGLHPGMTAGALAAHDAGIVTAASVAAVGRALPDTLARLAGRPRLDLGIHLVLVGERPLSPPREVPSLLGRDGALLPGHGAFVRRYLRGGIAAREVEVELRRQLERLLAAGLRLVHANSHQHLHVLPGVFEVVLGLAAEYRIPFLRLPAEPAHGPPSPRAAGLAALGLLSRRARRRLRWAGAPRALDGTLGLREAGHLTVESVESMGRSLGSSLSRAAGASELVCHPGLGDAALAADYPWGYAWAVETAALCDPRLPGLLAAAGVELTSFSRLLAGEGSAAGR